MGRILRNVPVRAASVVATVFCRTVLARPITHICFLLPLWEKVAAKQTDEGFAPKRNSRRLSLLG
jgi:hypothetical protein